MSSKSGCWIFSRLPSWNGAIHRAWEGMNSVIWSSRSSTTVTGRALHTRPSQISRRATGAPGSNTQPASAEPGREGRVCRVDQRRGARSHGGDLVAQRRGPRLVLERGRVDLHVVGGAPDRHRDRVGGARAVGGRVRVADLGDLARELHQLGGLAPDLERDRRRLLVPLLDRLRPDRLLVVGLLRHLERGHHAVERGRVAVGELEEGRTRALGLGQDRVHPLLVLLVSLAADREVAHHRDQRRAGGPGHRGDRAAARRGRVRRQLRQELVDLLLRDAHLRPPSALTSRSRICSSASNPSSRRCSGSPSASAAAGTNPTISDDRTCLSRSAASALTASNAALGDVTSTSTRFIETVTAPRSGTANPIARTAGRPPPDSRTAFAISLAASSVPVRYRLNATSGFRAPTAVAPARPISCGPKSGRRSPRATASRSASNSPLRTSARLARSGEVAARSYR